MRRDPVERKAIDGKAQRAAFTQTLTERQRTAGSRFRSRVDPFGSQATADAIEGRTEAV